MPARRLIWVCAALGTVLVSGTPPPVMLQLRWRTPVRVGRPDGGDPIYPGRLDVTPRVLLVSSGYSNGSEVALDRSTGRELWHRDVAAGDPASDGWPPELEGAVPGPNGEIAVFSSGRYTQTARPRRGRDTQPTSLLRLSGVASATGRTIWQQELRNGDRQLPEVAAAGMAGSLLVLARTVSSFRVEFRDGANGAQVVPGTRAGDALLRRAEAACGAPQVGLSVCSKAQDGDVQGFLLDLPSGRPTQLPPLFNCEAPIVVGDRAVARVDTDDGGVGHSLNPKYVCATDLSGRKIWQFPRQATGSPGWGGVDSPASVELAAFNTRAGIAAAQSDCLRGIRIRDGSICWTRPPRPKFCDLAPFARGFLALRTDAGRSPRGGGHSSLAYVDGASGRVSWLAPVPETWHLTVDGNALYLTSGGAVFAYSLTTARPN